MRRGVEPLLPDRQSGVLTDIRTHQQSVGRAYGARTRIVRVKTGSPSPLDEGPKHVGARIRGPQLGGGRISAPEGLSFVKGEEVRHLQSVS